jgi:hypothetical protein
MPPCRERHFYVFKKDILQRWATGILSRLAISVTDDDWSKNAKAHLDVPDLHILKMSAVHNRQLNGIDRAERRLLRFVPLPRKPSVRSAEFDWGTDGHFAVVNPNITRKSVSFRAELAYSRIGRKTTITHLDILNSVRRSDRLYYKGIILGVDVAVLN